MSSPKPIDANAEQQTADQQPEITLPAVRQKVRDAELFAAVRDAAFALKDFRANRQALGRLRNHGKR
jgi:hypothetical protein